MPPLAVSVRLYGSPTCAVGGGDVVVMCSTSAVATMRTKSWVVVIPLASVAVIVKGKDPGTHSGVPDNTPVDDSATPEGSVPVSL